MRMPITPTKDGERTAVDLRLRGQAPSHDGSLSLRLQFEAIVCVLMWLVVYVRVSVCFSGLWKVCF